MIFFIIKTIYLAEAFQDYSHHLYAKWILQYVLKSLEKTLCQNILAIRYQNYISLAGLNKTFSKADLDIKIDVWREF